MARTSTSPVNLDALADTALVNDKTAALQFGISRTTFWRWIRDGKVAVHPVKITQATTRFRVGEIRRALAQVNV